ncbi:UV radiation resistance protein and autophagy-related subunit 14-domain-containing protein [Desarmillaria tabescens]|uniref:Autophagy-related protein 14 n=1 Tax=Armillaria tabescens TaxID=1929756 RepID=A0AA39KBS3_ARMTA|nr:UV radiation resistance protein and autophagy-related subunit 14-domain-containing protein [Desarmillaria tabescens]KAK0458249.1 UV radiation resistance protein and autophagy-related subunit 14-domain-containing protein [Desarmillaria tabescens]
MDCKICELKQRQFYCENCLKTHIRDFRIQTQHFAADRDDQVAKSSRALDGFNASRIRRANISDIQSRVDELMNGLASMRKDNEKKRDRLRALRETLATRRQTLSAAKLQPQPSIAHQATREAQELKALSVTIARARSGLVQELVEVFNVVEVGGRPPIGGKAGTKGEWTIGDLILPVPGDIRRYPPDHINAVITHTIHFVSLLTLYLGVKLPFEIHWTGKKLGVGQPWIGAVRGSEHGGWAKWHTKHPLHLSSTTLSTATPSSTKSIPITSESYLEPDPEPQASFTTALAMLLYNVSYLAYTQNVDVPLNQAGDVLSNLWSVCCSSDLGKCVQLFALLPDFDFAPRRSHETNPFLPPPTPAGFGLDFMQLLQATTANPASRVRAHKARKRVEKLPEVDEDGWDIVEDTT